MMKHVYSSQIQFVQKIKKYTVVYVNVKYIFLSWFLFPVTRIIVNDNITKKVLVF